MIPYFLHALRGQLRQGKTLFFLSLFGVAIGVGSVISIQILNRNALSAFRGSVKAISGDADLTVTGRTPALDETVYPDVLATPGVDAAWPLYRVHAAVRGHETLFLEVIGVDLLSPSGLPPLERPGEPEDRDPADRLHEVLNTPGWVALTPALAADRGWKVGDAVPVSSGARRTDLRVGALVDFQRYSPLASRKLALMDIAQAQTLLGRPGEIHEIHVRLAPDADLQVVAADLRQRLGGAALVLTPEARENRARGLLAAFRLNLTALSLISLFVGVFLIYTSTQNGLVRRRPEFGLLRSLGATRGQVLGLILMEISLLGALGTLLGIPLGYAAATLSLEKVNATITSIYLLSEIDRLEIPPSLFVLAAGVGIGGAVLGGVMPALDIGRRDTRSLLVAFTLREKITRLAPRLARAGGGLLVLLAVWFLLWGRHIQQGGFVLGFGILVFLPLFTPLLILRVCGSVPARGLGLSYSLKTLALKVHTTSFAVASLAVAVSMLIGVTLLIGSFRATLETWLDRSIRADVYITTESWAREGRLATLTPELLAAFENHPGVSATEWLRQFRVEAGGRSIALAGVRLAGDRGRPLDIPLVRGNQDEVLKGLEAGGVLIGEPLSRKTGIGIGDSLRVAAPGGEHAFCVVGVSYDYSEAGSALVLLPTMERVFGEGPINNTALFLDPALDPEPVIDGIRDAFRDAPLLIRSNRELREHVLDLFDQTFAVTRILQLMALLVAATSVSLTLLVLARERVAELALYRALGALRRQIFRVFLGEGLAIGVLGLILGFVGGLGLAAVLIYVINPAYFGWTIRPAWAGSEVLREMILILAAATAASVYPALRASRMPVRELSRDDL